MSYGAKGGGPTQSRHERAIYVDKILRGAKPADLPFQQPTEFDFVVNAKTAQALGLTIPPDVTGQVTSGSLSPARPAAQGSIRSTPLSLGLEMCRD